MQHEKVNNNQLFQRFHVFYFEFPLFLRSSDHYYVFLRPRYGGVLTLAVANVLTTAERRCLLGRNTPECLDDNARIEIRAVLVFPIYNFPLS